MPSASMAYTISLSPPELVARSRTRTYADPRAGMVYMARAEGQPPPGVSLIDQTQRPAVTGAQQFQNINAQLQGTPIIADCFSGEGFPAPCMTPAGAGTIWLPVAIGGAVLLVIYLVMR